MITGSLSTWRRICLFVLICASLAGAQQLDPQLYIGLRWRMIGPFRGGRSIAVSGVEGQPHTFYFGAVGGGVWKTVNAGESWEPVFDGQPIGSIGAIAVAQSNPYIIYVGTGEADFRSDLSYGDGIYKSTDGGKTWKNLGLRDSRHIARIVIDPHNPDIVLVAAMGEAYGPSVERGIFKSADGGSTWQKVLFKDDNTGAIDIAADPDNPQNLYASLVHDQRPPWSTYAPTTSGGSIYASSDGGSTWKQITGGGLPSDESVGRIGLAVARGTQGRRVYAMIDHPDNKIRGLYRSDNAGKTWIRTSNDLRVSSRGWYFGEISVDPKNPDVVYSPNVSIYRSSDAGKTFAAIKGAPGGDDYHQMWINPNSPQIMIFGSDQGVGVSVDGGSTWSSWYNQPTAQLYHVAVDNQFPYHVYGAQQDSGSVDTTSRSNDGSITFRDWHPTAAGESGYVAPDPKDANIIYGGSTFGELFRYDRRTGQAQIIAPEAVRTFGGDPAKAEYRFTWTSPLVFSPQDSHTLYYGSQHVLKSADQGSSWQKISPDLTGTEPKASHERATTPENAASRGHGVVYTIAPSPIFAAEIWAGSDTGLIHLTRDGGKTWTNVTPPNLPLWSKISLIDAGHFDAGTAYAAIDRHRMSDIGPWIYRTHDFGKSWTRINNGIPTGAYVRAVREDPIRKGLLFAGTERGVFFSINDGESWQPLQLNLPVSPVHDLVIKDKDLVIATHGRSFWILDDFSPLREFSAQTPTAPVHLFKPATAIRIRANTNHDTPLPPEVPAGENPPPGAIFYYYLKSGSQSEVRLEILDSAERLVRAYSSHDRPWSPPNPPAFPNYWFRPPEQVSSEAGMHRLVWDLRYAQLAPTSQLNRTVEYSMSTAYGQNVQHEPQGPYALPGSYHVRLTVEGKSYTQSLKLVMDPRVQASAADLQKQLALEMKLEQALVRADQALAQIQQLYSAKTVPADKANQLSAIEPPPDERTSGRNPNLSALAINAAQLLVALDSADAAPTLTQSAAAEKILSQLDQLLKQWQAFQRK
jgi:photosystem II stability/assembly factor-like uncharacterized protein